MAAPGSRRGYIGSPQSVGGNTGHTMTYTLRNLVGRGSEGWVLARGIGRALIRIGRPHTSINMSIKGRVHTSFPLKTNPVKLWTFIQAFP